MSRKKKNTTVSVKLTRWQKRLADSNAAYSAEVQKMDERERIYNGENTLRPLVPGDTKKNGQPKTEKQPEKSEKPEQAKQTKQNKQTKTAKTKQTKTTNSKTTKK